MKRAARSIHTRAPAQYSKTLEQGVRNSYANLASPDSVFNTGISRMVVFKGYQCFSILALTIEEPEGQPSVWHLSMSAGNGLGSIKMPDDLAKRFAKAFSPDLVEGPPEGVFDYVRHFRGPCPKD
jgi:hypothetical protein